MINVNHAFHRFVAPPTRQKGQMWESKITFFGVVFDIACYKYMYMFPKSKLFFFKVQGSKKNLFFKYMAALHPYYMTHNVGL